MSGKAYENEKLEVMKRIKEYMTLMEEMIPQDQNEVYASLIQNINILNAKMDELYTRNEEDKYPELNEESSKELTKLYINVMNDAQSIIREQGKTKTEKVRRDIAKGIYDICEKDVNTLISADYTKGITLPELVKNARTVTVDLGNQELQKSSGSMSSRIPIEYTDENGNVISGFFTKESYYTPTKEYQDILAKQREEFPQFSKLIDELSKMKITTENLGQFLYEEELNGLGGLKKILSFVNEGLVKAGIPQAMLKEAYKTQGFTAFYKSLGNKFKDLRTRVNCMGDGQGWLKIPEGSNIDSRNTAMSVVANLLNMPDIIAKAESMEIVVNGEKIKGTFMANAKGSEFYHLKPDDPIKTYGNEVYDSPKVFNQLADLQVLDYICGNLDRHEGNFFMEFDTSDPEHPKLSKITGIDNDMSFGTLDPEADKMLRIGNKFVRMDDMACISRKTFDTLMGIDDAMLKTCLRGFNFSEGEINACCLRLNQVKEKVLSDIQFFKDNPGKNIVKGKIKIIEDDQWKDYSINDLSHQDAEVGTTKKKIIKESIYNQFLVFSNVDKYVFKANNISKEITQPLPNVKKPEPAKGKLVPRDYAKDSLENQKANNRISLIKQDIAKTLMDQVKDATLALRGSNEFKLMSNKLEAISKLKLSSNPSFMELRQIADQYQELAILAYEYIEKKRVEENPDKPYGDNTNKRIAAARKVLEFASSYNPEAKHFLLDKGSGTVEVEEYSKEDFEIKLKQGYNDLKRAFPKIKIDYQKARELMLSNQEQLKIGLGMGLIEREKEADQRLSRINTEKMVAGAGRLMSFLFLDSRYEEKLYRAYQERGVEGYNLKREVAEDLLDRIGKIDENLFKNLNKPEDYIMLKMKYQTEFKFIFDNGAINSMFRELNYSFSEEQERMLTEKFNRLKPLISRVDKEVAKQQSPYRFLLDPRIMSEKDAKMVRDNTDVLNQHGLISHIQNTPDTSDYAERAISITDQLAVLNFLDDGKTNNCVMTSNGKYVIKKGICDAILNGEVCISFKPNEIKGTIITGMNGDGGLIVKEGTRFDAYMVEIEKNLKALKALNPGKKGDPVQVSELCTGLEDLLQDFSLEKANQVAEKAKEIREMNFGRKGKARKDELFSIAGAIANKVTEPKLVTAFNAFKDERLATEEAETRTRDYIEYEKQKQSLKENLSKNQNAVAKLEDEVKALPQGELKTLGLQALGAKMEMASTTAAGKFGEKLQNIMKGYMSIIIAYEDKKVNGEKSRPKEFFAESKLMGEYVKNMDKEKVFEFLQENKENDFVKAFSYELHLNENLKKDNEQLKVEEQVIQSNH